jgi:hypothetical protein
MIGKVRSIHLKKSKRYLQARETKKESPKHCANVVEELAVNVSSRRPTRAVFNFLRRPSVKRIGIVMYRPGVGSLEEGPVIC